MPARYSMTATTGMVSGLLKGQGGGGCRLIEIKSGYDLFPESIDFQKKKSRRREEC